MPFSPNMSLPRMTLNSEWNPIPSRIPVAEPRSLKPGEPSGCWKIAAAAGARLQARCFPKLPGY